MATVGILPPVITPKHLIASQAVVETFRRRLMRWVRTDKPAEFAYREPPDLEKLFKKVVEPPSQIEVAQWIDLFGVEDIELNADFPSDINRAREHVVGVYPKLTIDTAAGPQILPLTQDDADEVCSVFTVVDDPEKLLDEMDSWTLTDSQAAAFRTCYPELYAAANDAIRDALTAERAKDDEFGLPWEQESVLNTLRGLPPEIIPVPPPAPPPERPKVKIDSDAEKTQGQASAAPKLPG